MITRAVKSELVMERKLLAKTVDFNKLTIGQLTYLQPHSQLLQMIKAVYKDNNSQTHKLVLCYYRMRLKQSTPNNNLIT